MCRQVVPDSYVLVPLVDASGRECGCLRPMNSEPRETKHCTAHGRFRKRGMREMVQALRECGYEGRILIEVPVWSHAVCGKRQGRTPSGDLQTGHVDLSVDIVLEKMPGDIYSTWNPPRKTSALLGIEVCGLEHRTNTDVQRRDVKKQHNSPFEVVQVWHREIADEDNEFYYDEEAEKCLSWL